MDILVIPIARCIDLLDIDIHHPDKLNRADWFFSLAELEYKSLCCYYIDHWSMVDKNSTSIKKLEYIKNLLYRSVGYGYLSGFVTLEQIEKQFILPKYKPKNYGGPPCGTLLWQQR